MKKKRKKKATSQFCTQQYQPSGLPSATSQLIPSLGSAPDISNGVQMKNDLQSCVQFAQTLFGNDGCKALAGDIHLRTFIRQISEQMVVRWNTVMCADWMFVQVPLELSRDCFVELLDYAEESLNVTQMVVCIERANQSLNGLVKSFSFMGFSPVPPGGLGIKCCGDDPVPIAKSMPYFMLSYDFDS